MLRTLSFMAARKFGTTGAEHLTWAMNTYLPGLVAKRYHNHNSRIVTFSTGNVYPLRLATHGGADESSLLDPVGEYAQSAVGRERMFEYASHRWNTPVAILRLNYATDLRYGVLLDIGTAVFERRPVDLRMPLVNIIWQVMPLHVLALARALPVAATGLEYYGAGNSERALHCGRIRPTLRDRTHFPIGGIAECTAQQRGEIALLPCVLFCESSA
jgi:nucleoside-diphosphate-sugar epimerase